MNNSRRVENYRLTDKDELFKILSKYNLENRRPIPAYIKEIKQTLLGLDREIIIDAFCGVGESTYHLAKQFPNHIILGFDKSLNRLETKSRFKEDLPENMLLFRSDIMDLYPMLYNLVREEKLKIYKQFILYPNPWPKKKNLKRRIYANPIVSFVFALSNEIEVRSNWGRLIVEFSIVSEYFKFHSVIQKIETETSLTPFERKYRSSDQNVFKLNLSNHFSL